MSNDNVCRCGVDDKHCDFCYQELQRKYLREQYRLDWLITFVVARFPRSLSLFSGDDPRETIDLGLRGKL